MSALSWQLVACDVNNKYLSLESQMPAFVEVVVQAKSVVPCACVVMVLQSRLQGIINCADVSCFLVEGVHRKCKSGKLQFQFQFEAESRILDKYFRSN